MKDKDYEAFLDLDTREYLGKWVAFVDGRVIATRKTFKEVYTEAKEKCPSKSPLIAKIPSKKVMIL